MMRTEATEINVDVKTAELKVLRREIKQWEHKFLELNNRKPTKEDISKDDIAYRRYKKFSRLKTSLDGKEEIKSDVRKTNDGTEKVQSEVRKKSSTRENSKRDEQKPSTKERVSKSRDTVVDESVKRVSSKSSHRSSSKDVRESISTVNDDTPRTSELSLKNQRDIRDTKNIRAESTTSIKTVTDNNLANWKNTEFENNSGKNTWGALPDNFIVRKSTIPEGPRSTSNDGPNPFALNNTGIINSLVPKKDVEFKASATSAYTPISAATAASLISNSETNSSSNYNNPFSEFINRRKELETGGKSTKSTPVVKEPLQASPSKFVVTPTTTPSPIPEPVPETNPLKLLQQTSQFIIPTPLPMNNLVSDNFQSSVYEPQKKTNFSHHHHHGIQEIKILNSSVESIDILPPKKPVQAFGNFEMSNLMTANNLTSANSLQPLRKPSSFFSTDNTSPVIVSGGCSSSNVLKKLIDDDVSSSEDEKEEDAIAEETVAEFSPSPEIIRKKKVAEEKDEIIEEIKKDGYNVQEMVSPISKTIPQIDVNGLGNNVKATLVISPELFKQIPVGSILRCRVFRKKNILDKSHPSFFMYNEGDEKFLMAARKRKKSKDVNFIISKSLDGLTKNSKDYIAKLKANSQRTNFVLMDARYYNEKGESKGLKEIGIVNYSKTILPREMNVGVPLQSIEENSNGITQDITQDFNNKNQDKLMFLHNKTPRWNDATQSHCLNFGGRVSLPSIKNFQLVSDKDDNQIIMQFGRCGPDFFTLDARWPMSPVEAFSIALTAFDAYDCA